MKTLRCLALATVLACVLAGVATASPSVPAKKKPAKKHVVAKKKKKVKASPTAWLLTTSCDTYLPIATVNAVTGNQWAVTKVVTSHYASGMECELQNADWPGPNGSAGAATFTVEPTSATSTKYFDNAQTSYEKDAAKAAASCPPGGGAQPDSCTLIRPFGASSFELEGYLFVLTKQYLVLVWRGGADYTVGAEDALANAVLTKLQKGKP